MAKTSGEFEKEFIESATSMTGHSVSEWIPIIKKTGLTKQMELTQYLKSNHKLNHLQASLLAGLYLNDGKPVYQNEDNLLNNQFAKATDMKPLFELISQKIISWYPDSIIIPKKTYISFTAKREFAAINIKPGELRLGMDLGTKVYDEKIIKSKLTGPMPRISHMCILNSTSDLDKDIQEALKESYLRSNK